MQKAKFNTDFKFLKLRDIVGDDNIQTEKRSWFGSGWVIK